MPFNLFTHETRTAHAQKVSENAAQRVKYEKFSSYKIEIVIRFFQMNFPRKTNIIYFNLPLFLCIHAVPHIANTHTDAVQFNVLRMRWHILVVRHTLRASLFEFFASIKHPQRKTTNSYHFVSHFFHAAGEIFANVYCMRTVYGRTGDAIISNCRIFRIRDVC